MAQLAEAVSATEALWQVDSIPPERYLRVDDELVEVIDRNAQRSRIRVRRGVEGTTAATHASGTELETQVDVVGSSAFGGGGEPTTYYTDNAAYAGNAVNVLDGNAVGEYLTWDSHNAGAALLDLTNPAQPTVLVEGIYSVTVTVTVQGYLTAGGMFLAVLHLDHHGNDAVCEMTGGLQKPTGGDAQPSVISLNNTFYIPADGVIAITLFNRDGAATRPFYLREAMIQRLS